MTTLSDIQFRELENRLRKAGLLMPGLYHDLLDHMYCLTTKYMDEEGKSFEEALDKAQKNLAPDGFIAIEHDVSFFLNFHIQIRMKRILYLGAFLAAFGQTAYVLFRTLHWPGANYFLFGGIFSLLFLLLPGLLFQFKQNVDQLSSAKKIRFGSGVAGVVLFALGSAFKVFYLPGGNVQILLGTSLLALVFFPLYFWQVYKEASANHSRVA